MKSHPKNILVIIAVFLIGIIAVRALQILTLDLAAGQGYDSVNFDFLVRSGFNFIYIVGAYILIKKYRLLELAGLGKAKFNNWFLLLFPLYIILINLTGMGDLNHGAVSFSSYAILALYVLSVGASEEYLLRGFLQSVLLKRFGHTKKGIVLSVIGAGAIFGVLHLIKFDKGLYGEITQVIFATFIGVMFGAILLRTNKIWPLVIIHALVDFVAKLDEIQPVQEIAEETTKATGNGSIMNLIFVSLLLSPCLIYGLLLLRKVTPAQIQEKLETTS